MIRILAAGLLVLWLGAGAAVARDFYVVPKAEADAARADGSIETPFPTVWAALRSGKISGGDRIVLRDGTHGAIKTVNASYDPPVQIVAENAGQAHAELITVQGGNGLQFSGISVWPSTGGGKPGNLVNTDKSARDIHFDAMDIRGHPDAPAAYMGWSKDEWLALRANGARLDGPDNHFTNSKITGVLFGITTTGDRTVVTGNRVEGFGGDAMRGMGDASVFAGNRVENCVKISDNHDDGFQSWATKRDAQGRKTVTGLVIEGNAIFEWTGQPGHPLRCKLQGIGLFDGIYRDFTIRNNLIVISAYHGIALYGGHDSRIVNNTVVNVDGAAEGHPWILLRDNRNGWESGETLVSNNVAMAYKGIKDAARRNGISRYPAQVFSNPAAFDFRLKPDSPFVDAGTAEAAPDTDITGAARTGLPDLGAFEER